MEEKIEIETLSEEKAKFRQQIPIEVLMNKKLRKAFGIRIPPKVLLPKVGRNDGCPCGSGKKFKKCCIDVYDREQLH